MLYLNYIKPENTIIQKKKKICSYIHQVSVMKILQCDSNNHKAISSYAANAQTS